MESIKKGDQLVVPDSTEPMIASRDEYNSRVWAMTAADYAMQSKPGAPRANEEPYLILPDRTLMRHYEHGFSDQKYDGQ